MADKVQLHTAFDPGSSHLLQLLLLFLSMLTFLLNTYLAVCAPCALHLLWWLSGYVGLCEFGHHSSVCMCQCLFSLAMGTSTWM